MNSFITESTVSDLFCEKNYLKAVSLEGKDAYIKHDILQSLYDAADEKGFIADSFYTQTDCDMLGAVYIRYKNLLVFDGEDKSLFKNTLPTGVCIFDTSKAFSPLYDDKQLTQLFFKRESYMLEAKKLKTASLKIAKSIRSISSVYINKAKVLNYILRFASKYALKQKKPSGINYRRQLSSIGAWGVHSFYESVMESANYIVTICDSTKALAPLLIDGLSRLLNECGLDTVTFYCSLDRTPEHLVIPELKVAFFSNNIYHEYPLESNSQINLQRFLKAEIPKDIKSNICRQFEMCCELIDQAVFSYLSANNYSNKISDFYYGITNENKLAELKNEVKDLL